MARCRKTPRPLSLSETVKKHLRSESGCPKRAGARIEIRQEQNGAFTKVEPSTSPEPAGQRAGAAKQCSIFAARTDGPSDPSLQ